MSGEGTAPDNVKDPDETKDPGKSEKTKSRNRGKGLFSLIIKILIVVLLLGVASYFIYFNRIFQDAFFIVSSTEINSPQDKIEKKYISGGRVYFLLTGKEETLNASLAVLEIDFHDGTDYRSYKKVTYEIDTDFSRIGAYLPGEYFRRAGMYRIRASIDGKDIVSRQIIIE